MEAEASSSFQLTHSLSLAAWLAEACRNVARGISKTDFSLFLLWAKCTRLYVYTYVWYKGGSQWDKIERRWKNKIKLETLKKCVNNDKNAEKNACASYKTD